MSGSPMDASVGPELRQLLASVIRVSPFDFIRRVDREGDKALLLEQLTRPLSAEDDLRLVCALPDGTDVAVFAHKLTWDSEFFAYPVAKIDAILPLTVAASGAADYGPAVAALLENASAKGVTYLFAAVDARDLSTLRALGEAGFALVETRLYYHRSLEDFAPQRRYAVRTAVPGDIELLGCAARDTVNPYDRFHADPFIEKHLSDRLMYKWVEASILDGFADVTFVPDVARPKAFCTVRYHRDKWQQWGLCLSQPVFSAVAHDFTGWYMKLISEISLHLKENGAQHAYMITQATNLPVVRTWESLGYHYGKTEHILRKVFDVSRREQRG